MSIHTKPLDRIRLEWLPLGRSLVRGPGQQLPTVNPAVPQHDPATNAMTTAATNGCALQQQMHTNTEWSTLHTQWYFYHLVATRG
jgi:hypothetical protein